MEAGNPMPYAFWAQLQTCLNYMDGLVLKPIIFTLQHCPYSIKPTMMVFEKSKILPLICFLIFSFQFFLLIMKMSKGFLSITLNFHLIYHSTCEKTKKHYKIINI